MTNILIDSSFLIALYNPKDPNHSRAKTFIGEDHYVHLIPQVALPEVTFLLNRAGGSPAVARFLQALTIAQPVLEPIIMADLTRIRVIRDSYRSTQLDFVDCCIVALSERLDIGYVATFDRRDFSIIRPRHVSYLDLLP